jgi:hypothetical protein
VFDMNIKEIGQAVDRLIAEEELPTWAGLRVERKFDSAMHPMGISVSEEDSIQETDPEEIETERSAWCDFIRQHLEAEHKLLSIIPQTAYEKEFWTVELDEMGHNVSAFNTMDYLRTHKFSLYHWQLEKLCKKVINLAIDFSIVQDGPTKMKLRDRAFEFIQTGGHLHKETLFKVWMDYAYWE